MKRMICFNKKKFCFRRCSTALPTVFRSSPAFFCSRHGPCNRRRRVSTSAMLDQRVMSVATVQQQLQASGLNERIEIGP